MAWGRNLQGQNVFAPEIAKVGLDPLEGGRTFFGNGAGGVVHDKMPVQPNIGPASRGKIKFGPYQVFIGRLSPQE